MQKTPTAILVLFALNSCGGKEPAPERHPRTWDTGTLTETYPQFYEEVPRNLLMISIDTTRKDHIERYGMKGGFPFMNQRAAEGVALDEHTQCSNWTFAGTTCTLLGRYNIDNGHMPQLSKEGRAPLPDGTPMLASYLGDLGFYSVLVSGNGWLSDEWANTQGYDDSRKPGVGGAQNLVDVGLQRLQSAMASGSVDRWFLHVHLMEPHVPYVPPDGYLDGLDKLDPLPWDVTNQDAHYSVTNTWPDLEPDTQQLLEDTLRVRYEGEIAYLSDQLDDIWKRFDTEGYLDDTLVVIWNDHGEAFWEHEVQTHAHHLFGEENDAFLIFWAPNIISDGWSGPTVSVDLVPTLLSLYGVDPLPPELTGVPVGQADPERYRFAASYARQGMVQSVRRGPHKLQYWWGGSIVYHNLDSDPGETNDLYDPNDATVQELWGALLPKIRAADPLIDKTPTCPAGLECP